MMPVTLSIKNVPDALAGKLRQRAARAQRSMQGELLVILREAVEPRQRLTAAEALRRLRVTGLQTDAESVSVIRGERDGR
jgi:plasmid stability protein